VDGVRIQEGDVDQPTQKVYVYFGRNNLLMQQGPFGVCATRELSELYEDDVVEIKDGFLDGFEISIKNDS